MPLFNEKVLLATIYPQPFTKGLFLVKINVETWHFPCINLDVFIIIVFD